jgi:hypothetical protein
MGIKREPDPASCEKHGAARCWDCLREHHLAETALLIRLLAEYACDCEPALKRVCELHAKYAYLFTPRS